MKTYQRDVLVINILLHITFLSVGINVKKNVSKKKSTAKNLVKHVYSPRRHLLNEEVKHFFIKFGK